MEQECVRSGLGRKAIPPVLLGGRPPGKQDMLCMYSADRQTRAKGRPMTTRMVEGTNIKWFDQRGCFNEIKLEKRA